MSDANANPDADLPDVDIAKSPAASSYERDVEGALRIVRILYVMLRDDWRRLFTCAHLWPLVLFFFLPWVHISCNERNMLTQTGFQAAIGGTSVDPKFRKAADMNPKGAVGFDNNNPMRKVADDKPGWSALTIVYAAFVLLGGFVGLLCIGVVLMQMRIASALLHLISLSCGTAAFAALALQMAIGFPLEKHTRKQIDDAKAEQARRANQIGVFPQPNDAFDALIDVDAKYSAWLWLSVLLAFVSLPVLFLEFGIVTAQVVRRHLKKREDSG